MKFKGYLLAIISAATYGTNPAFAVPLYEAGINANSVLIFRYLLALPILAIMLKARGHSLALARHEIIPLLLVGIALGLSSLGLFESYMYMNSGVASTLLFIYPVMVAMVMILFYGEKFRMVTAISLIIMALGMTLLMHSEQGFTLSAIGCALVILSSATYTVYLVFVNVSKTAARIPTLKLTFYSLLFGLTVFVANMTRMPLTLPTQPLQWGSLLALAILPTVVSFLCATRAIQIIGSTSTAILGALEPVTAVILSVVILHQPLTPREISGGLLILIATTLIVSVDRLPSIMLRVRRLFPRIPHKHPCFFQNLHPSKKSKRFG